MFELMLNSGGGTLDGYEWCPDFDTGPGPQCMQYDPNDDTGFFGEVSSEEFINGQDLASLCNVTQGTLQYSNEPWLKFYIDGRILYTPRKSIRHSISWSHLNAGNNVNGVKVIGIQGYQFKVALWNGINSDYTGSIQDGYDLKFTHNSDWNRLLYRITINDTFKKDSQKGPNWAEYSLGVGTNELNLNSGNGSYVWCKELYPGNTSYVVTRGVDAISRVGYNTVNVATSVRGWRPVLELIG